MSNDDVHDLLPYLLAWEEMESFLPVKIPKKKIVTCKHTQTALSESNGRNNEKVENKQHISSSLKHSCKDETIKLIPGSKVIEKEVTGEKEDGVVHVSTDVGKNEKAELDIVNSKLKATSNVDLSSKQVNKTRTDSDNDVDEITLKSTNNGGEFKDEWLPILSLLIQGR